jgi:alpha-mannosidase
MNNHWGTNYRAYQEGPTLFRFILRPHGRSSPAEATRFATGFSQPLLAMSGAGNETPAEALLRVEPSDVIVIALKPSDDGKATIIRLFGASGKDCTASLSWSNAKPKRLWLSNTSEMPLQALPGPVAVPAWGLVTLRAELN